MNISSEIVGNLQILNVEDERIDAAAAIQFKDSVRDLIKGSDHPVVLNLENVEFVDSSGLGAIVAAKKFLGTDRPLHLAGLTPIVAKVFALTRMERVFQIYASAADAVSGKVQKSA